MDFMVLSPPILASLRGTPTLQVLPHRHAPCAACAQCMILHHRRAASSCRAPHVCALAYEHRVERLLRRAGLQRRPFVGVDGRERAAAAAVAGGGRGGQL